MDYLRIWADNDGESHLEEVTLDRVVSPAAAGIVELCVSAGIAVDRLQFLEAHAVDQRPDWHCAPRRQFVVWLDGWVRITTSDGDTRLLPTGSVVLAEDLHGKGHVTEHESGVRRILQIPLGPPATDS
jgi:hypothetical protein